MLIFAYLIRDIWDLYFHPSAYLVLKKTYGSLIGRSYKELS